MIDRNRLLLTKDVYNCEVKTRTQQLPFHYVEHNSFYPPMHPLENILAMAETLVPEDYFLVKIESDEATEYFNVVFGRKLTGTVKLNGQATFISHDFDPEMESNCSPEELLADELELHFNIHGDYVLGGIKHESTSEEGCQREDITYNIIGKLARIGKVAREDNKLTINYEDGTVLVMDHLAFTGFHKEIVYMRSITAEEYEKGLDSESTFEEVIPF